MMRLVATLFYAAGLMCVFSPVGGCVFFARKSPPVVPQPAVVSSVREFAGSPLSRPIDRKNTSADLQLALRVNVKWIAIDKVLATPLRPLDAQSRLTFAPLNKEAVLPVGMITRDAYFGADSSAADFENNLNSGKIGKTSLLSEQAGFAVPGSTIEFTLADSVLESSPGRQIVFSASRKATSAAAVATKRAEFATISVRIDDYVSAPANDSGQASSGERAFGRETAIVDDVSFNAGSTFALVVPITFKGTPWKALAAVIEVDSLSPSDDAALAKVRDILNQSSPTGAASQPSSAENFAILSAIAQLDDSTPLRSPLLFLATQTGSEIAPDFSLVADDALLTQLAQKVKTYSIHDATASAEQLGWILDRSSLQLMAESAMKPNPSPQIISLLSLHTGEVGRQADAVLEILKTVNSRPELERRLVAENLIFLEDDSPSSRVRAFDWLKARGKSPQGYDPLGNPKSRRTAIDNAITAGGGAP